MASHQRFFTAILFCLTVCAAQEPSDRKVPDADEKASPTGTVTGHVYLDDTKAPGRRATVFLEPAASLQDDAPPERSGNHKSRPITLVVDTRFDGSFIFTHVPTGSYFVMADCPGYISPYLALSLAEARTGYGDWSPPGPDQKSAKDRVLHSLQKVNVQSILPVTADIVLERGGAVSGTVTYDDGSPATGIKVAVLAQMMRDGKETWDSIDSTSHGASFGLPLATDDRGSYRISGLPAGKYVVEVSVEFSDTKRYIFSSGGGTYTSNAHTALLSIYSGNTPRKKDAAAFAIQPGEERTGEDVVIPMSKLHTIKGNIVSAHDGHIVNSGRVELLNADDHFPVAQQSLTEDDPSFTLSFIFEGEYILSSTSSADVDYVQIPQPHASIAPAQYRANPRHFYGSASMPLHVSGDMDAVTISVPEPTQKENQMYREAIQQQEQQKHPAATTQR
jgi:hypothetical protein